MSGFHLQSWQQDRGEGWEMNNTGLIRCHPGLNSPNLWIISFGSVQSQKAEPSHNHLGFVINPADNIGLTSSDRIQRCGKHSAAWFGCWYHPAPSCLFQQLAKKKTNKKLWSGSVDTACATSNVLNFCSERAFVMCYWSVAAYADHRWWLYFCTVTVYSICLERRSELAAVVIPQCCQTVMPKHNQMENKRFLYS